MGTWGIGIMENDLAQDAKLAFDDALGQGRSISAVVRAVKQQFQEGLDSLDEYPDLVLALAWLASARGKVPKTLKDEAARVVREGLSLRKWVDQPKYDERRAEELQLLDILDERRLHPEPHRKVPRIKVRIGHIFEIPLSDTNKAFGQYVYSDKRYGPLIQVFNLISDSTPSINEILSSGTKFPPIITALFGFLRMGLWRIIGHAEVTDFRFPMFRSGISDAQGKVSVWYIYDGKEVSRVGALPHGAENYEVLIVWGLNALLRRIETGENPYAAWR